MTITTIKCIELKKDKEGLVFVCNLPYTSIERNLTRTITKIETSDGITGFSVLPGFHGKFITESLKPMLIDQDPFMIKNLWEKMYSSEITWGKEYTIVRNLMQFGEWWKGWLDTGAGGAVAAVDIALYDLIGKATKLPIYKLLGGYKKKVLAYADGEAYPEIEPLEKTFRRYVDHGYKMVKVHIQPYFGSDPITRITKQTELVRKAIGEHTQLAVDFFSRYTSEEASKAALAIEKFNPIWIEDPVYRDDLRKGLKKIKDTIAGKISIAAGERVRNLYDARDIIEFAGVDILNIYPFGVGGITPWMKIAALAEAHHVEINSYGGVALEVQCHLVAAVPNALAIDVLPVFCPICGGYRWPELFIEPIEPIDGYVEIPDKPGLGVELNEEEIRKHKIHEY